MSVRTIGFRRSVCAVAFAVALSSFLFDAQASYISRPDAAHTAASRRHTGIPSIAVARNGRLWVTYYGSPTGGEDSNNYCTLTTSIDGGKTWKDVLVADPDGKGPLRAFDPEIWAAPDGRIFWTWTERVSPLQAESKNPNAGCLADPKNDKLMCIEFPGDDVPSAPFPKPRCIARGVMMCKPMVRNDGIWLFPSAHWGDAPSGCFYASRDAGKTFSLIGGITLPEKARVYDEHMAVQLRNGDLLAFLRTQRIAGCMESVSKDGGVTWSAPVKARMKHTSSRFFLRKLRSGNLLLVKHGKINEDCGRRNLTAYLSRDDGETWEGGLLLDARKNASYPDGDQETDGLIRIVYDHDRLGAQEILMASFTEEDVLAGKAVSPKARLKTVISKRDRRHAANLAQDTDFRTDNLGGIVNWVCIRPQTDRFEILDERGPDGGHAIRLMLSEEGGLHQTDYKFVNKEPYRMSAWVRTKNLKPDNVTLIAYDDWLHISVKSRAFPSDTHGKWVKVEWKGEMFTNIKNAWSYFGVQAQKAMGADEVLDVAGLEIEPLSEKARANTISPKPGQAFVPRIVPIMPKLAEVDLDVPDITFYYPGDLKGKGRIRAYVDGSMTAEGELDADRRVTLRLEGTVEGRHKLRVVALDGDGEVARNEYTITVRRHLKGAEAGRRLNNLVTELPVERTPYGIYFNAPEKGWYFMSCDKPEAERMQYLDPGRHPVPFPTLFDAKVTVRKIKRLVIGGSSDIGKPTDFKRNFYGVDFFDRFLRPSMNTMSMWDWERSKRAKEMKLFEERGIAQTYSIGMHSGMPVWSDPVKLAAAITNCNGYLEKMQISLDETSIARPRKVQYAIAEALWSLADVEDLRLGVFYNDAMRRGFSDRMMAPSVLSAIANCGGGTGILLAEAYSSALPDKKVAHEKGVGFYPKFQASVERMSPVAGSTVVYHVSGYIAPYLWCNYPASTVDFKVFFADLIRAFATDPVYRDIPGISFSALSRIDEELVRWMAKVFRHYGIEGRTDDICEKYGYRYFPGHLVNNDFDKGLQGWDVLPAKDGSVKPMSIPGFGTDILCFRECPGGKYGDRFAVMKRGATGPNVLRQKAKGLTPGRRYFFSVVTMDLADVRNPGSVVGPTHFRVDVDGAEIIPETRFRHEFATGKARRSYRGKPCVGRVIDRFVFTAKSDTATITLSDWGAPDRPGGRIGGETVVTYVICRPYYTGSEDEFREIIKRWPTNR